MMFRTKSLILTARILDQIRAGGDKPINHLDKIIGLHEDLYGKKLIRLATGTDSY